MTVIEDKVKGATLGAGAAQIVTAFCLWGLDELFWRGGEMPDVPVPVTGLVGLLVTAGGAFLGGYVTRHTPRPETPTVVDGEL